MQNIEHVLHLFSFVYFKTYPYFNMENQEKHKIINQFNNENLNFKSNLYNH